MASCKRNVLIELARLSDYPFSSLDLQILITSLVS
jgi:hypothetical protein